MPNYEYRCEDCGHVFEKLHGMSEEPELDCPRCSGQTSRIISGGSGVIFKGSGFYATDDGSGSQTRCSQDSPCCGRAEHCDTPPCEE